MTAQLEKPGSACSSGGLSVAEAGGMPVEAVLAAMETSTTGLSHEQAEQRSSIVGPNAVRSHQVHAWAVLGRQLRSALLVLLVVTATIAFLLGDHTDAIIIALILTASIGLACR
jgi:Mg2+-importing ATPase